MDRFVRCFRCVAFLSWSALVLLGVPHARAQEPATKPSVAEAGAAKPASNGKQKYSHANDYLIRGSVFTDKALSFPGVKLRIRRAGEKKFRWEDYTNSRGEFAIRVPQGSEYEMVVHAKGFADQTKVVDAKNGTDANHSLVFRMQPAAGGKK
jgi:hypothetical protein